MMQMLPFSPIFCIGFLQPSHWLPITAFLYFIFYFFYFYIKFLISFYLAKTCINPKLIITGQTALQTIHKVVTAITNKIAAFIIIITVKLTFPVLHLYNKQLLVGMYKIYGHLRLTIKQKESIFTIEEMTITFV